MASRFRVAQYGPSGDGAMSLIDSQGRSFKSLRLSLTSACNYACDYCVPDGTLLKPSANALSGPDLMKLVGLLHRVLGIKKIRLTGGEPLIAPNLNSVLEHLPALGIESSLTTNGQFLADKAQALADAGVGGINVSLDAIQSDAFLNIAKRGDLATVLKGIEAALALGLRVKMNTVPMRSKNLDQLAGLFEYCADRGIELRFIELMRMGHLADKAAFDAEFVSEQEIVELLSVFGPAERQDRKANSTSYNYVNPRGVFGFISNESAPFCGDCDRLRLSSEGKIYGCISSSASNDIRPALQMEQGPALAYVQEALSMSLKAKQPVRFSGEQTIMQIIGG